MGVIDTPNVKKTTMVKAFLALALFAMFVLFVASSMPRREEGEGAVEHAVEEIEEFLHIVKDDDGELMPSPAP